MLYWIRKIIATCIILLMFQLIILYDKQFNKKESTYIVQRLC